MIKTEMVVTMEMVSDAGIHGLSFGIADGILSDAEIEAAIEIPGPTGRDQRVEENTALRFVKLLGAFQNPSGGLEASLIGRNGSPLLTETIRWTFLTAKGWKFWVYNRTGVTMGAGNIVNLVATHYGVWVT